VAEIKLTKNELRAQQTRLSQLHKYLPTLQLKKAMLQSQVSEARAEIAEREEVFKKIQEKVDSYSGLLAENAAVNWKSAIKVEQLKKRYENIAGVEVPYFESISFRKVEYNLFETPAWVDPVIEGLQSLVEANVRVQIAQEKKAALEKELREVSIRVNLFEKVLIPRAVENIKTIKVFLGDQQLSAVSQAKVAKGKIERKKLKD
jgi:V/A-type H+-transporting ATPase subunit D